MCECGRTRRASRRASPARPSGSPRPRRGKGTDGGSGSASPKQRKGGPWHGCRLPAKRDTPRETRKRNLSGAPDERASAFAHGRSQAANFLEEVVGSETAQEPQRSEPRGERARKTEERAPRPVAEERPHGGVARDEQSRAQHGKQILADDDFRAQ